MSVENFLKIIKKSVCPEARHFKKMQQDNEDIHSILNSQKQKKVTGRINPHNK